MSDLRSLMTVLSFVAFLAVFVWAWKGRRRASFDDAAQLPFAGDAADAGDAGEDHSQPNPDAHRTARRGRGAKT